MNIFAYIDRSAFAESVWQHAVWAAKKLNASIELVHVLDHPASAEEHDYSGYVAFGGSDAALEERMRLDEIHNRLLIEEGRTLLDAIADRIRSAGVPAVTQRLYQGTIVEHLDEHAHEAVMTVVGKRGEAANQDPQHLGRNIERLVRSAHKPVLIASETFTVPSSATLAWDGGKSSGEAVHFLATRPLLHDVPLTLLHVTDARSVPDTLDDARAHLETTGMQVSINTVSGSAVESILTSGQGREADLLVLGAYGHSRIRQLVVGSTTTEILMRAEASVLVFH